MLGRMQCRGTVCLGTMKPGHDEVRTSLMARKHKWGDGLFHNCLQLDVPANLPCKV